MTARTIRNEAISASAGSGKTFQLAHRYIRLLAENVPPDRISALTFSRKAAGEIFDSIVQYLSEATVSRECARQTAERIEKGNIDQKVFLGLLRQFVGNLHRLHIGTLDSFIIGVVRAFPVELGISADFQVLDNDSSAAGDVRWKVLGRILNPNRVDRKTQRNFHEAFKEATFGNEEKELGEHLDRFVDELRSHYKLLPNADMWGNEAVIWPSGTHWLQKIYAPEKAADKLCDWLPSASYPRNIINSLLKFIEFAGQFNETARWDTSLDDNRIFRELLRNVEHLKSGSATITYGNKEYSFSKKQCELLYKLLCHVVGIELRRSMRQTRGLYRVLAQYEQLYDEFTRRNGTFTFDDAQYLLTEANTFSGGRLLSRLADQPGRLYIDYRLDAKLDHWLLDEFQDTSDLQWAVLRNLADEILQDSSGQRSFFYVGDVKQAIYGWRGGNARLFGKILKEYDKRIHLRTLNTSYRSCQSVIATVNSVFGAIKTPELPKGAVEEWNRLWQEHRCQQGLVPENGCAALFEPQYEGGKDKPTSEDRYRIVSRILQEITPLDRGLSVAILTRSNDAGREIVDFLRRECPSMTVVHEGKATIKDNPVVQIMLALVKFAAHPGDNFSWRLLQMSPLNKYLEDHHLNRSKLPLLLLHEIQSAGLQSFIRNWGARIDVNGCLDAFGRMRLADLITAAGEFDGGGERDCGAFLRFIDNYEIHELAPGNSIRVMTIHQSKGLGFDIVILPDLMGRNMASVGNPGFVDSRGHGKDQSEWALKMPRRCIAESDPILLSAVRACDEEGCLDALCVLYVAMTRAKQALYMITSYPGSGSKAITAAAFLKIQLVGDSKPENGSPVTIAGENYTCLYETGEREWYKQISAPIEKLEVAERRKIPKNFAEKSSRRTRLVHIEPSAHEESVRNAAWLFNAETRDVLDFGISIHELFEKVEWLDDFDVEAVIGEWLTAETVSKSEDVKRDVCEQFRTALKSREVRNLLSRPGGNVELWREKRFEIVLDNTLVAGVFDRVTIMRRKDGSALSAEVLDYKSDRIRTDPQFKQAIETYKPQLLLYRRVLSKIMNLSTSKIIPKLIFTRKGRVFTIGRG